MLSVTRKIPFAAPNTAGFAGISPINKSRRNRDSSLFIFKLQKMPA